MKTECLKIFYEIGLFLLFKLFEGCNKHGFINIDISLFHFSATEYR